MNTTSEFRNVKKTGFPVAFIIEDRRDSYNESGNALLDKNQRAAEYRFGDTAITVQRFFDGDRTASRIVKELIEVELYRRNCYNGLGNIAVASQQKEGS